MSIAPAVAHRAIGGLRFRWFRLVRIAFSLSPLILVHLALISIPFLEFSWWYLFGAFIITKIAGFGVTVGLHRYCSHRAFKTPRWCHFLLAAAGCTALQKGPLWWSVHHRLHHRHSDEPGDPHSPIVDGFLYGHCGWLFANDLMHPDESVVHDLKKFPELVWLDRLWMVPGLMLAGICYAIGGVEFLVYGYCLAVASTFQMTFAVNSIGHMFGPQRFKTGEGSRNNFLLGFLALGDGWHNNHHRAPYSARHGFAWYELDMSYTMIKMMAFVGLAWDLKLPPPSVMSGKLQTEPVAEPESMATA